MSSERWIVVRNWDRFQHPDVLRTERPAWVKTYTGLLHDDDFLGLSERRRLLLVELWLLYASTRGRVAVNTRRLSHLLHMRVTIPDLESLNHAGFIEFSASKPASKPASRSASLDKRREENPPTPLRGNNPNGRHRTPTTQETKTMIDVTAACQRFIEGHSWDETCDTQTITDEFHRIERSPRTQGELDPDTIAGLLEQWAATRQDRHGIPANLGTQADD